MSTRPTGIPPEIVTAMGALPTDEQWAAISMPLKPYVLVAGAGSGKTSVMAARVVFLALAALDRIQVSDDPGDDAGVLPGNVLCLTFTVKATENLRSRVRRALAGIELPEGEEPEILNYHAMAAQVLERHGILAGIEAGRRVLSQAQRVELAGRVLDEMEFVHTKTEWQPSVVDKILNLDSQIANHLLDPDEVVAFVEERLPVYKKIARTDRVYYSALERIELAKASVIFRRLKRELGVIDFSDQIELAMQIAAAHPEVGREYRDRFGAVLLDEYQDTNVAQARLMQALFGNGHPVTAVGDPDQNIYAWRGASLYNLLEFPTAFRDAHGGEAARLPLFTNFRSGARILHAADAIIEPLPAAQRPDPDKHLVPFEPNGQGQVTIAAHRDELTEARWIAEQICALHDGGASWSQAAVLCRTSRLFFLLQQAFAERDIPAEIVGLAGLLRLPEVVEVLAYARAANDPTASVALARVLMSPRYRVGFKDLALVAGWAKGKNYAWREDGGDDEETPFLFAEALEHLAEVEGLSDEGLARLQEFRDELAQLRAQARRPVAEFLGEVIRSIGILDELDADVDRGVAAQRGRNLAAFLDQVHGFEPVEGELTLRAFLDYVDAVEQLDKQEWEPVQPSDDDAVKVMTIHQAKGLEFDHVFVPGVASGLMPSKRIQQNPAERGYSLDFELRGDAAVLPTFDGTLSHFKRDLQAQEVIEERRTMYVALTRARRTLWVSASTWYGENVNAKGPSEFFTELATWGQDTGEAAVIIPPSPRRRTTTSPASRSRTRCWATARHWCGNGPVPRAPTMPTSCSRAGGGESRPRLRVRAASRPPCSATSPATTTMPTTSPPRNTGRWRSTCSSGSPARVGRWPSPPRRPWAPARSSPTPNAPSASTGPRCDRCHGSAGRPRASAPRSMHGSNGERAVKVSCSRSMTAPTSPTRSWPATRAGSTGSARRSWAADSSTGRRCSPSERSCCGWAVSPWADGSTRSSVTPTVRGRSSIGRRASAPRSRTRRSVCSSTSTGWRAWRSGAKRRPT